MKTLEIAVIISRYSTASSSLLAVYGVIRATTFFLSVALSEVGQIDKLPRATDRVTRDGDIMQQALGYSKTHKFTCECTQDDSILGSFASHLLSSRFSGQ